MCFVGRRIWGWDLPRRYSQPDVCMYMRPSPRMQHAATVAPGLHTDGYRKSTKSKANLPAPMFWHKVLHQ
jgi:hypothetical protein